LRNANAPPQPPPGTQISSHLLLRIIILLIAVWTGVAGAVLLAVHGVSSGALGAGVTDQSGQRLVGIHMLLLVPVYLVIVVRYDRFNSLIWLPFAAQLAVALVVGYGMFAGETSFSNGILAFAVCLIFAALFAFVWITQQRDAARARLESEDVSPAPPQPEGRESAPR
jgi:hypothetical protein